MKLSTPFRKYDGIRPPRHPRPLRCAPCGVLAGTPQSRASRVRRSGVLGASPYLRYGVQSFAAGLAIVAALVFACGSSGLHAAASKGDPGEIRRAAASGADVNAADAAGFTPLHLTVMTRHAEAAGLLLDLGADAKKATPKGMTALHFAILAAGPDMAEFLIAKGAEVNASNDRGETPLHIAADIDFWAGAKILIGRGADIDAKNRQGRTPLHLAAKSGATGTAKLLLDAGAEINARDESGLTPVRLVEKKETATLFETRGAAQ